MEECAYITEYFALVSDDGTKYLDVLSLYVKPVVMYYYQYLSHDM